MNEMTFAIEARGLTKHFGAVKANDQIDLRIKKGAIHGIVGENGAGKSTLLKQFFGLYHPDAGQLLVHGQAVDFISPKEALQAGIGMVHQHFMLVESFTVLENIMLGAEEHGLIRQAAHKARRAIEKLRLDYGFDLPLDALAKSLSVGERQRLEIMKALYRGADILILDEPTAVLTPQECDQLFALMQALSHQGKTILFVTHKLKEIMVVTDQVSVIRGGRLVGDYETRTTNADQLAELMVGARIVRRVAREQNINARTLLRLDKACLSRREGRTGLRSIDLELMSGQILGVAGVAGNGQSELLETIAGLIQLEAGEIRFGGVVINSSRIAIDPILLRQMGLAHVAEDRLRMGAVAAMSAEENAILGYQRDTQFCEHGILRLKMIAKAAERYFEDQDVRPRDPSLQFGRFSGGNQQKLVIARELAHEPELFIIGQPSRGVDIGAVTRIHDQLTALRNRGKAVLVVSADLDELLAISDEIIVMSEGHIMGRVPASEADERRLGLMMAGQSLAELAPSEAKAEGERP